MVILISGECVIMQNDEKFLVLEQYRIYSEAKDEFTSRNFQTNRFYLVLTLVLFLLLYIFFALTPAVAPMVVGSLVGMSVCIMWWLNLDSYQFLIKIKYAKVLEEIEKELPVQPYKKEYESFNEAKKNKKAIIFSDFQKSLTIILFCVFLVIFSNNVTQLIINFSKTY